jgi:hypothetical protein
MLGKPCRMVVEPNEKFCRYHLGDWRTTAARQRNREGTKHYWERYRFARELARLADAARERLGATPDCERRSAGPTGF